MEAGIFRRCKRLTACFPHGWCSVPPLLRHSCAIIKHRITTQAPQVWALHGGEATWGCFHRGVFDGYSAAAAPNMSILNTHAHTHTHARTQKEGRNVSHHWLKRFNIDPHIYHVNKGSGGFAKCILLLRQTPTDSYRQVLWLWNEKQKNE